MDGPDSGWRTSTIRPKPTATASLTNRSMTASPLGPIGASGLHPPYLRAMPAASTTRVRCHALPHPPQRSTALAQVMPPPNPVSRTWWPARSRPVSRASARARGMDADEVLP